MKVIIELDESILEKVQTLADSNQEKRSRKQMLELLIERAVKWLKTSKVGMKKLSKEWLKLSNGLKVEDISKYQSVVGKGDE